jgi:N-methylhydantoinase A
MAPVAALTYGRQELENGRETPDLLVCDTGGTTFDVGVVTGGQLSYTSETWLGGRFIGHITGIRSVNVKSIGAGGGSLVWIDPGGLLRVGPRSAGADPGPACYGRGGTQATVTDAAVALGYIDPGYFLGGRIPLDADAARVALQALADPLGLTVEETASAVLVIATENIVGAIRELTIAQGIDPRDLSIVAGGGASGLNIVPIARELGCRHVLLPNTAAALSACGALHSDAISEFGRSFYTETRAFDFQAVNGALAEGRRRGRRVPRGPRRPRVRRDAQGLPRRGALPRAGVGARRAACHRRASGGPDDVAALEETFHEAHERVFAVREPGQHLECLLWKVRATAVLRKPEVRPAAPPSVGAPGAETTTAYFRELGSVEVPRLDGPSLPRGERVEGPAIIREATTTVVVYPGSAATVMPLGNYLLEVAPTDEAAGPAMRATEEALR